MANPTILLEFSYPTLWDTSSWRCTHELRGLRADQDGSEVDEDAWDPAFRAAVIALLKAHAPYCNTVTSATCAHCRGKSYQLMLTPWADVDETMLVPIPIVRVIVDPLCWQPECAVWIRDAHEDFLGTRESVRLAVPLEPEGLVCQACGNTETTRCCQTCKNVAYCCEEHQIQDWPAHRPKCRAAAVSHTNCDKMIGAPWDEISFALESPETEVTEPAYDPNRLTQFHLFPQLPFELRLHIWELVCPPLKPRPRIWVLFLARTPRVRRPYSVSIGEPFSFEIRRTSTISKICRETRALADSVLPDKLSVGQRGGYIRFNRHSDVVFLKAGLYFGGSSTLLPQIPGFSDVVQNLSLEKALWDMVPSVPSGSQLPLKACFPRLRHLYLCLDDADCIDSKLVWCTTPQVYTYLSSVPWGEPKVNDDKDALYVWPDLPRHVAFAQENIPPDVTTLHDYGAWADRRAVFAEPQNQIELWPMVHFRSAEGIMRFEDLANGLVDDESAWYSDPDENSVDEDEFWGP